MRDSGTEVYDTNSFNYSVIFIKFYENIIWIEITMNVSKLLENLQNLTDVSDEIDQDTFTT